MDGALTKNEKKQLRQEEWKEKLDKEKKERFFKTLAAWSFGGLLLVLAIWALVIFSQGSSSTPTDIKLPAVTSKDFQSASNSAVAKVTVVEYADFQCPACKSYHPVLTQLKETFGNSLNVVYRMFPLKTIHPHAMDAAKAAYGASKQQAFWPMHDKLFDNQDAWATLPDVEPTFVGYAKDLGLNIDEFKKDYMSQEATDFVNTSYDSATNIGITSTPTFFVNGQHIENPAGYEEFKKLIADEITKSK